MHSVIAAEHLGKMYGTTMNPFVALNDVTIDIASGESVAIVGKSGSGKSTLMHLLALLDAPTSGAVKINDVDAQTLSTQRRDLLRNATFGFVFQQFFLNGNDTVLSNVILPLKIAGMGREERTARGMDVLGAVGLTDKAQALATNLSGGQKQRVCVARALVNNPQIIFADEPTGNLDSVNGAIVEDMLFDLHGKNGITLIVVTHDPDLAKRCSREIHLIDGSIVGAPAA